MKIPLYYSLGDTASILTATEKCVKLYKSNGLIKEAADAYPTAILLYLKRHEYGKAHELMRIFETQSGAFDEKGNIEHGREHYYYYKVLYHLGVHQMDSAEHYSRKLLQYNRLADAYRGLLNVYGMKRNLDSIVKYAPLYEESLSALVLESNSKVVIQVSSLYDYSRNKKIANEKSLEAQEAWFTAFALAALCVCVAVAFYLAYRNYRQKKRMEISVMVSNYNEAKTCLEKTKADLDLMEVNYNAFRDGKEKEIRLLQEKVDNYEKQHEGIVMLEDENIVMDSDIVKTFRMMSHPKRNVSSPSDIDWEKLVNTIKNGLPSFSAFVTGKSLTEMELYICILVRLDFSSKEIALLLDTTPQVVTNTKAKSNHKLFGETGASSLKANLKNIKAQE